MRACSFIGFKPSLFLADIYLSGGTRECVPSGQWRVENGEWPNNLQIFPSYIIAFGSSPSNSDQRYYLHIFALAHIVPPQGDMWDFQPIGNVLTENSGFYLKF